MHKQGKFERERGGGAANGGIQSDRTRLRFPTSTRRESASMQKGTRQKRKGKGKGEGAARVGLVAFEFTVYGFEVSGVVGSRKA